MNVAVDHHFMSVKKLRLQSPYNHDNKVVPMDDIEQHAELANLSVGGSFKDLQKSGHALINLAISIAFTLFYSIYFASYVAADWVTLNVLFSIFIMILYRVQSMELFFFTTRYYETIKRQSSEEREFAEKLSHEMRQLIASVAHDVKSPLSAFIQGFESLRDSMNEFGKLVMSLSPDVCGEYRQPFLEGISFMKRTIDSLVGTYHSFLMTINRCTDYTKISHGIPLTPVLEKVNVREAILTPIGVVKDLQGKPTGGIQSPTDESFFDLIAERSDKQSSARLKNVKEDHTSNIPQSIDTHRKVIRKVSFPTNLGDFYEKDGEAPLLSSLDNSLQPRILVVDDSLPILKMLQLVLEKHGYRVTRASNGLEAVEKFVELQDQTSLRQRRKLPLFDAILMDIQMPIMTGIEATKRIREIERSVTPESSSIHYSPSLHHLIIAMSATTDNITINEAYQIGIDEFLPKPFQLQAFENIMRQYHKLTSVKGSPSH
eukprot:gene12226-13369_t